MVDEKDFFDQEDSDDPKLSPSKLMIAVVHFYAFYLFLFPDYQSVFYRRYWFTTAKNLLICLCFRNIDLVLHNMPRMFRLFRGKFP